MRSLGLVLLFAAGCSSFATTPVIAVVALTADDAGGAVACGMYEVTEQKPFDCCTTSTTTHYQRIALAADGARGATHDGGCSAVAGGVHELALDDGGVMRFDAAPGAPVVATRLDADGQEQWRADTLFTAIGAASAPSGDHLFIGQGAEVAKLMLADGQLAWTAELR
jgi:hypothetical protein